MRLAEQYARGKRFRVIKPGAKLSGLKLRDSGAMQGWSQTLDVGDVIESLGFGPGWGSDPGYGIHWTTEQIHAERVQKASFRPSEGGVWSYHPPEGYLEEVNA